MKHKFNAVRTERHGLKFDSRAEAAYYDQLLLRKKAGEVVAVLTQVPFRLPGNSKYVVDFLVFEADGSVRFVDVKGAQKDTFRLKKRIVEELYAPIEIEVVDA